MRIKNKNTVASKKKTLTHKQAASLVLYEVLTNGVIMNCIDERMATYLEPHDYNVTESRREYILAEVKKILQPVLDKTVFQLVKADVDYSETEVRY